MLSVLNVKHPTEAQPVLGFTGGIGDIFSHLKTETRTGQLKIVHLWDNYFIDRTDNYTPVVCFLTNIIFPSQRELN